MKFFRYDGTKSFAKELADYHTYVRGLDGAIPQRLLMLMDPSLGLDDGLLVRAEHDPARMRLELKLRCGDSQLGYYDLVLTYRDVSISARDEKKLKRLAETTINHHNSESDLCWHEIDVLESGGFEHRLLFHRRGASGVSFSICCSEMSARRIPRSTRRIAVAKQSRFVEVHVSQSSSSVK